MLRLSVQPQGAVTYFVSHSVVKLGKTLASGKASIIIANVTMERHQL
jgi:hypothetical protein